MQQNSVECSLCGNRDIFPLFEENGQCYQRCRRCKLIFAPEQHHLTPREEKSRYDLHENDPDDKRYRNFLNQLAEPMMQFLSPGVTGLDFGSGPGPTLHIMFEEKGFDMDIFDIYYHNDKTVFDKKYDFITATEVVEHLQNPGAEIIRLWNCLKPGGLLGIMTKRIPSLGEFENWHYRRDDTHVTFFADETFEWLTGELNGDIIYKAERVVILQKE